MNLGLCGAIRLVSWRLLFFSHEPLFKNFLSSKCFMGGGGGRGGWMDRKVCLY